MSLRNVAEEAKGEFREVEEFPFRISGITEKSYRNLQQGYTEFTFTMEENILIYPLTV